MALARTFLNWLWRGKDAPSLFCVFCEAGRHVHNVNTGLCITRGCKCVTR